MLEHAAPMKKRILLKPDRQIKIMNALPDGETPARPKYEYYTDGDNQEDQRKISKGRRNR